MVARFTKLLVALVLVCAGIPLGAMPAQAADYQTKDGWVFFQVNDDGTTARISNYDLNGPKDVIIPAQVTDGLRNYDVTTISNGTFFNRGLTSVTIPGSVTTIGQQAFGFNSLTSLTLPDSITTIGDSAFTSNSLTSLTIPASVTTINPGVFANNRGLRSVSFLGPVTSIGVIAFRNGSLTSITIPNSVTTIGDSAFMENSLTSVTIPASVTSIGANAFGSNPGLMSVRFDGDAPATVTPAGAGGSFDTSSGSLLVHISWGASNFTMPSWMGYDIGPVRANIVAHPSSTSVAVGGTVVFSAAAAGVPTPTVRWQVDTGAGFTYIAGATSTSLTVPSTTLTMNNYRYRAIFENSSGNIGTFAATLTVTEAPAITTHPSSTSVAAGSNATFAAAASGGPAPTVQWQMNDGTGFSNIVGATTTTLTVPSTTLAMSGHQYRAVFSNSSGPDAVTSPATLTVLQAPTITTHPSNTSVAAGGNATFAAAAIGGPAPTVQWQMNTGAGFYDLGGATSNSLDLGGLGLWASGYQFRAVFTNSTGTVTTNTATLTVTEAPIITVNLYNTYAVSAGSDATFTAAATGTPAPTVQWRVDEGTGWTDIVGATSTSLNVPAATLTMSGNKYLAVFTNSSGHATTTTATLIVTQAPTITTNPSNTSVTAGSNATFTAAATGGPAPTVQWQVDTGAGFTNIAGATTTTLTVPATTLAMSGHQYQAVFSNSSGDATTTAATLTVTQPPTITTNPLDTSVAAGGTATFTATATGGPAPTVQWQVDQGAGWIDIVGATSTSLTVPAATLAMSNYRYMAVFINSTGGATTTAATLTVTQPPTITTNSLDTSVAAGGTATFTATATGGPAPTIQWQVNDGAGFTNIAGATTTTLTVPATTLAMNGNQYLAVFTNSSGDATTTAATLTVTQAPAITGASTATFTEGAAGSYIPMVVGSPAPTVKVTKGVLPEGLNLDPATGAIAGTPAARSAGSYVVELTATNTVATSTLALTLTVNAQAATPTATTPPPAPTMPLATTGWTPPSIAILGIALTALLAGVGALMFARNRKLRKHS